MDGLSPLRCNLPSVGFGNTQPSLPVVPLGVKVLSWNINGSTVKGCAECRNLLVPCVVTIENPDALLLQEVFSEKIIGLIANQCRLTTGRSYCCVYAGSEYEARILYDPNVFEEANMTIIEHEYLKNVVAELCPVEDRCIPGWQEMYVKRVALVPLRHKATGKLIIFMSFHNKRWGYREATMFCQIVSKLAVLNAALVVAGTDLNCDRSHFTWGAAYVPEYTPTWRRALKRIVDHIIYDSPSVGPDGLPVMVPQVTCGALDIFPSSDGDISHPYSNVFRGLWRPDFPYSVAKYSSALDHDPVVCYVCWNP